jgi:hypothetical protein
LEDGIVCWVIQVKSEFFLAYCSRHLQGFLLRMGMDGMHLKAASSAK